MTIPMRPARLLGLALALHIALLMVASPTSGQASPLVSSVAWLAQVAKGEKPKLTTAPLVQFETGNRYYKIMLDSMADNFRKSIVRSSERSFSLHNTTSIKPISVATNPLPVSIVDLHIEGLEKPKVSNIHVNKKNMKLHVSFYYKNVKVSGKCSPSSSSSSSSSSHQLFEASGWNVSWSANLLQMVGRDHFDMSKVYSSHSQKSAYLAKDQECLPPNASERVKSAIIDRLRAEIDARLVETMEGVMMRADSAANTDDTHLDTTPAASSTPKPRIKRSASKKKLDATQKVAKASKGARQAAPPKDSVKAAVKPKKQQQQQQQQQSSKRSQRATDKTSPAGTKTAGAQKPATPAKSGSPKEAKNPAGSVKGRSNGQESKQSKSAKLQTGELSQKNSASGVIKTSPRKQQQQPKSAAKPNPIVAPNQQTPKTVTPKGGAKKAAVVAPAKRASSPASVASSQPAAKKSRTQASSGTVKKATSGAQKASKAPKALKRSKRDTPCEQGEEADDFADQLLRFGSKVIKNMEPFTLPNTTIELPDYNLKIFLYDGQGTRIHRYRRVKPAWVYCDNDTISLGLTLEVDELRTTYKYRVISGYRLLFDGDLQAKLSPRLQVQFSQAKQDPNSEEEVQQRLEKIRLFRLGRVHVIIRGLGNLTQSLSMMINQYLNDNQEELQPTFRMLEGDAVRMANKMLERVTVPILGVV